MMQLARRALLAAFSLLISATTAHAECVWVLWAPTSGQQRSVVGDWSPDETFQTKNECRAGLDRAVSKFKGRKGYEVDGDEVRSTTRPKLVWRFYCLPDTVDPRGPKGGRS
jgi:hypothetical protein